MERWKCVLVRIEIEEIWKKESKMGGSWVEGNEWKGQWEDTCDIIFGYSFKPTRDFIVAGCITLDHSYN